METVVEPELQPMIPKKKRQMEHMEKPIDEERKQQDVEEDDDIVGRLLKKMKTSVQYVTSQHKGKVLFDIEVIRKDLYRLQMKEPVLKDAAIEECLSVIETKLVDGITTKEISQVLANLFAERITSDPQNGAMAARILMENLHKSTPNKFSDCMRQLYNNYDPVTNKHYPLINKKALDLIEEVKDEVDAMIDPERDFWFKYLGIRTLFDHGYLISNIKDKIIRERPSYMYMRVALQIHGKNLKMVKETYDAMSRFELSHATPTLFNSLTTHPNLASCILMQLQDDSVEGIMNTYHQVASFSKGSAGIGLNWSNMRGPNSYIHGTNGYTKGIFPFIKTLNETNRAIDQGGKRKGAVSLSLDVWHAEFCDFLELKFPEGEESRRALDLFPQVLLNNLFYERVMKDENWSFFSPDIAVGLVDSYGEEFKKLYLQYESDPKKVFQTKPARDVWKRIVNSCIIGGTYLVNKDEMNARSNQKHLGVLKTSNLCVEVMQICGPKDISVCFLASIPLPACLEPIPEDEWKEGEVKVRFNMEKLKDLTMMAVRNLDKIIDENEYPSAGKDWIEWNAIPEEVLNLMSEEELRNFIRELPNNFQKYMDFVNRAKRTSLRDRAIGVGVQGLNNVFIDLEIPYESKEAAQLNIEIAETMYYGALMQSVQLAEEFGPHPSYEGSPMSQGIYQFHMMNVTPSKRWDWEHLENLRKQHGMRNSLLIALMPTKSTSHILGYTESFEGCHSMIYKVRVGSGEYILVNEALVEALKKNNLWNERIRDRILAGGGSIQNIQEIPEKIRNLFKTVWEISPDTVVDMAADRQPFIDQSQSMNLFFPTQNGKVISKTLLRSISKRLKTVVYYSHTQAPSPALQFTINGEVLLEERLKKKQKLENPSEPTRSPIYTENSMTANDSDSFVSEVGMCKREKGCLSCSS